MKNVVSTQRRRIWAPALHATTALLVAAVLSGCVTPVSPTAVVTKPGGGTLEPTQFHGVNWADPRDNFADDAVVPSGLLVNDDAETVATKTRSILTGFRDNLHANTVRLPVNPYSVGTSWWTSYKAAIDTATSMGFKVILSYWEGTGTQADGRIDDVARWNAMWNTLIADYAANSRVYFEPMNEPHGYTSADWKNIVATWLTDHAIVPRDRVFVSGRGYNDHVDNLCTDPRFDGTYLSLHHYGFWGTRTYAGWLQDLTARLGTCANRTIEDEFGAPMTTGLNYSDAAATDNFVAYMQADTNLVRQLGMGSVYWPGLRTGDSYSMESITGTGSHLSLATNNTSAASLLKWSWTKGAFAVTSPAPKAATAPNASAVLVTGTGLPLFDTIAVDFADAAGSPQHAALGTLTRDAIGGFAASADFATPGAGQAHMTATVTAVNSASGDVDPTVAPVTAAFDVASGGNGTLPPTSSAPPVATGSG